MRILVAEDSATARLLLTRDLETLGHTCVVAEDGATALQLFREQGADVVISDWMMPKMNGDELCRLLRAEESCAYFIMLTSLEQRSLVLEGMRAGADDFLTKPFSNDDLEARLIAAARVTELHRRLAEQRARLQTMNTGLLEDARSDPLTGCGNRLRLDEDGESLMGRWDRYRESFSLGVFDVDHFKAYNDSLGHSAGDEVLRAVAGVLKEEARRGDAVYRYGGEEFVVIFGGPDTSAAVTTAQRICDAVRALGLPHPSSDQAANVVTVSAGVAHVTNADHGRFRNLLSRADAALYDSKSDGRDRVTAASDDAAPVDLALTATQLADEAHARRGEPGAGYRLLLVEDDKLQAQMIRGMLQLSLPGHHALAHVSTLGAARSYLADTRVSCVLLDLTLPDASALDGLVDIRDVAPDVPVVVVTADNDAERAIKAVQAGAQDYLIKGQLDGEQLGRAITYAMERKRGELALAYQAFHDSLTGLPNRDLFLDRVTRALAQSTRGDKYVAVLFLDLDGFKALNDQHGHNVGDSALRATAGRLLSSMRPGDTVARLGGDEFTVVALEVEDTDQAAGIARRLTETVAAPLVIEGNTCELSTSIGVALVKGLQQPVDAILAQADAAMYEAKRSGSGFAITLLGGAEPDA